MAQNNNFDHSSSFCAADGENARRFRPDKGFQGVDYSSAAQAEGDGQPVQFEKDAPEADPFGLDQFLTDVRPRQRLLLQRLPFLKIRNRNHSCASNRRPPRAGRENAPAADPFGLDRLLTNVSVPSHSVFVLG